MTTMEHGKGRQNPRQISSLARGHSRSSGPHSKLWLVYPGTSGNDWRSESRVFQNCPKAHKTPSPRPQLSPRLGPFLLAPIRRSQPSSPTHSSKARVVEIPGGGSKERGAPFGIGYRKGGRHGARPFDPRRCFDRAWRNCLERPWAPAKDVLTRKLFTNGNVSFLKRRSRFAASV